MMERSELKDAWRARIADYSQRAGSTREWCDANGVTLWQLRYWRKRLSEHSEDSSPAGGTAWSSVRVVPEQSAEGRHGVTVHLGPARIEVNPGFDQPTLAQALRAIASSLLTGPGGDSC